MSGQAVLTCRGLEIAPGGRTLLSGLDINLRPGELVGLRGPSGSGKTSLLRVVCGLDDPAAGEIALRGTTPGVMGWPRFRRLVSLVAQEPLLPAGTIGAALARPFGFRACRDAVFDPARARAALAEVFVDPPGLDRDAGVLSVGERQRIALARALLLDAQVLLLDEPTSALDPAAASRVEDAVRRRAAAAGQAALIVSHDPAQTERWCDRVVDLAAHAGGRP
ncbi:ATP-binding cassette domain-containing protein [bacterium]|nr:ATP-binding cassette domain-containing protein [bacterium]MBU1074054.1 ATP-binding cassette domain-containing protein [bacterium]MBU1674665.1 ATP-binding cassette domain-containing protein [bacterium]